MSIKKVIEISRHSAIAAEIRQKSRFAFQPVRRVKVYKLTVDTPRFIVCEKHAGHVTKWKPSILGHFSCVDQMIGHPCPLTLRVLKC